MLFPTCPVAALSVFPPFPVHWSPHSPAYMFPIPSLHSLPAIFPQSFAKSSNVQPSLSIPVFVPVSCLPVPDHSLFLGPAYLPFACLGWLAVAKLLPTSYQVNDFSLQQKVNVSVCRTVTVGSGQNRLSSRFRKCSKPKKAIFARAAEGNHHPVFFLDTPVCPPEPHQYIPPGVKKPMPLTWTKLTTKELLHRLREMFKMFMTLVRTRISWTVLAEHLGLGMLHLQGSQRGGQWFPQ